ncbi:hypothetical protein [Phycicoccus avicenniae]|uniref:hypothetical protein n=1 Tax=Phycicoccus avicenniae TaxID=2828860 RepID=UPI003D28DD2F
MSVDAAQRYPSAPPPAAPRGDSTRTIAIVALVLSVLALVVPFGMFVAPMLLFAGVAAEPFDLEGPGSMTGPGGQGSLSGTDPRMRGGFVSGANIAATVGEAGFEAGDITCPDVRDVRDGTTVVCTAQETYVVVRFTDEDGGYRADWFTPDDTFVD